MAAETPTSLELIVLFVVTQDGLRGNSRLSLGPVGDLRTATTLPGVASLHIMAVHCGRRLCRRS
jgi:hypothetical protein